MSNDWIADVHDFGYEASFGFLADRVVVTVGNVAVSREVMDKNQLAGFNHHHLFSPDVQIIVLPFHRLQKGKPSTRDLKAVHPLLAMDQFLIINVALIHHLIIVLDLIHAQRENATITIIVMTPNVMVRLFILNFSYQACFPYVSNNCNPSAVSLARGVNLFSVFSQYYSLFI